MLRVSVLLFLAAARFLPGFDGGCGVLFSKPPDEREISGSVTYARDKQPLRGIEVVAVMVDKAGQPMCWSRSGITDVNGRFRMRVLSGGMRYRIGVNLIQAPMPSYPFPRTYYPGVMDQESATLVEVVDDTPPADLDIAVMGPLATRRINILVTWPDGAPAPEQGIWSYSLDGRPTHVSLMTNKSGRAAFDGVVDTGYRFSTQYTPRGSVARSKIVHSEPAILAPGRGPAAVHLVLGTEGYLYDHHPNGE